MAHVWTLLAVEVSYCEASCALGEGEEMLSKQSTDINDSAVSSEFVNELSLPGLAFLAFVAASLPETGRFLALQNCCIFFLFLAHFID